MDVMPKPSRYSLTLTCGTEYDGFSTCSLVCKGCFGDGNVPFLSFHFHTGIETIVCTVSALASRGAQRERACGRFRLHGALKKRALQGAMSSLSY